MPITARECAHRLWCACAQGGNPGAKPAPRVPPGMRYTRTERGERVPSPSGRRLARSKSRGHPGAQFAQHRLDARLALDPQSFFEYATPIAPGDDIAARMVTVPAYQGERLVDTVDLAVGGQSKP